MLKNFKAFFKCGLLQYLNGNNVKNHTGGHLPFEADVTVYLNFEGPNRITVAGNNTLSDSAIPQDFQKCFFWVCLHIMSS